MKLVVQWESDSRFPLVGPIKEILANKRKVSDLIVLKDMTFPYDNVKIRTAAPNGRTKLVDLGHPERFRANRDVTDDVKYYNGNPTFPSLSAVANSMLEDLLQAKHGKVAHA